MITLEKTCPPYSALAVDTGFTTGAIWETNSIPAKKTLCQDTSSPPGLSCWLFSCIRRVNQYLWTWIRAREITLCLALSIGLSSWSFQSGRVISGGYVRLGPIHVPCIFKSLRKHEPYSHVPHNPQWDPSTDEAGLHWPWGCMQPNFRTSRALRGPRSVWPKGWVGVICL